MVGKTKPPTTEEQRRLDTLKNHCPCLPCLLIAREPRLPTIQHVVKGMKRLGHKQTYSSCIWHHMGLTEDWTRQELMGKLGPSLAHGRRTFEAYFGSETLVLVPLQDFVLDEFVRLPWIDHNCPHEVRREARLLWQRIK